VLANITGRGEARRGEARRGEARRGEAKRVVGVVVVGGGGSSAVILYDYFGFLTKCENTGD
jgi:hypothetical protein